MKFGKWTFIIGFFLSGGLFFLAGTLTGYSYCEKVYKKTATDDNNENKTQRKPSDEHLTPGLIVGKIVNKHVAKLRGNVRAPSTPAIKKARTYRNEYGL